MLLGSRLNTTPSYDPWRQAPAMPELSASAFLDRFGPYRLQPYGFPGIGPGSPGRSVAGYPQPGLPDSGFARRPPVADDFGLFGRPGSAFGRQGSDRDPRALAGSGGPGGFAPGRQLALSLGSLIPGPIGWGSSALNAGLGLQAGAQQTGMYGSSVGLADMFAAATGIDLGGSSVHGRGGYGNIGIGGYTGMMNMMDPGVAGLARAMAASRVAAAAREMRGGGGPGGGLRGDTGGSGSNAMGGGGASSGGVGGAGKGLGSW